MHIVNDFRHRFGNIRDQGKRPSCLAMSTSDLHGWKHGQIALSAEYLFFCGIQRMAPPDPNVGLTTRAVAEALASDGQPLEADWPYSLTVPEAWFPPATLGAIWKGEVDFRRAPAEEAIRVVETGIPLVLGLSLTTAFFNADAEGHLPLHLGDADTPYRHAVLGVGVARSASGENHLLVRNSWGADWGAHGHAWLSASYLKKQLLWVGSMSGAPPHEAH